MIPHNDPLIHALNHTEVHGEHRAHAGLSQIGHNCHRFLQFSHYWAFESIYDNRVQRIFDTGHKAEDFMIADLEVNGYKIIDQQLEVTGAGGHWKGHIDGKAVLMSDFDKARDT